MRRTRTAALVLSVMALLTVACGPTTNVETPSPTGEPGAALHGTLIEPPAAMPAFELRCSTQPTGHDLSTPRSQPATSGSCVTPVGITTPLSAPSLPSWSPGSCPASAKVSLMNFATSTAHRSPMPKAARSSTSAIGSPTTFELPDARSPTPAARNEGTSGSRKESQSAPRHRPPPPQHERHETP